MTRRSSFRPYEAFGEIKARTVGGTSQRLDGARVWTLPTQTIFLGRSGQAVLLIISEAPELVQSILTLVSDDLTVSP